MEHTKEHHEEEDVEETPKKSGRTKWIIGGGVILIVVLILAIGIGWLYTGQLDENKSKVFAQIPLPAAMVSTHIVSMKDVVHRYDIAKEVLGNDEAESQRSELHKQILDRLIADAQSEAQADKLNVEVTDTEIEEHYQKLVTQLTGGDVAQFEAAVKENYKLNLDEFKQEVIRPDLLQTKLQSWFNSQRDLSPEIFTKTDEVMKKISSGENFGTLAKTYSDDETSKDLEGDAGTILIADMLPEFQVALKDAKSGDVKQITSRYGQHIVKVTDRDVSEGEDKAKLHLQQIFVEQTGFTAWYNDAVAKFKVQYLIKFDA